MSLSIDKRDSAHKRGYGVRWRRARKAYLQQNPLCVVCRQQGRTVEATVVDHIEPHRGDPGKFWDVSNWQSLCKPHHDSAAKVKDNTGVMRGCDESGWPIDPNHHWNR